MLVSWRISDDLYLERTCLVDIGVTISWIKYRKKSPLKIENERSLTRKPSALRVKHVTINQITIHSFDPESTKHCWPLAPKIGWQQDLTTHISINIVSILKFLIHFSNNRWIEFRPGRSPLSYIYIHVRYYTLYMICRNDEIFRKIF